jgi:hypothetical protein
MGFDVAAYDPVSHEIDGREPVSTDEARQLRLDHAARLERDVLRARTVRGD